MKSVFRYIKPVINEGPFYIRYLNFVYYNYTLGCHVYDDYINENVLPRIELIYE